MTLKQLMAKADALEEQIAATADADRAPLREKLHAVIDDMTRLGGPVPAHYKDVEHDLVEEEVEELFDNMPL